MNKLNHPKPNVYRENWQSLNGSWDFELDYDNTGINKGYQKGEHQFSQKINVPYVYQSKKSGVEYDRECNVVWYKRNFNVEIKTLKTYILHFEASDYYTQVWLNGTYIGENKSGFFDFSFDVGYLLETENELIIRVEDNTDTHQNLGKQTYKDETFLCWYTKSTGIWQDVWLEEVGYNYIDDILMTPRIDSASVDLEIAIKHPGNYELITEIEYNGQLICESRNKIINRKLRTSCYLSSRHADFRLFYWTPENPNLYDVNFKLLRDGDVIDKVESYFGMRKVSTNNGYVTINNERLFHKMILDQGYFGEGLMTPNSYLDLKDDVEKIKEMGFNGVRKHQKIESSRFMYLCDKLGLIMWAELPSFYEFSFDSITEFSQTLSRFVKKHYNHPSVCTYVLFNESWGINRIYDSKEIQNLVDGAYHLVKSFDNTRLVIGNDGWEQTKTDIVSIHDYNENEYQIKKIYEDKEWAIDGCPSQTSRRYNFVPGYKSEGQPFFISEYGGVAFETETAKEYDTWGYGKRSDDPSQVLEKIKNLTNAFADNEYISGICYTQLSDVEQEVNGLLDHNHQYKFPIDDIKKALITKREGGFTFE